MAYDKNDADYQYDLLKAEYLEYASEARACGYEVLSFEDWKHPNAARRRADERYADMMENDTLDLY